MMELAERARQMNREKRGRLLLATPAWVALSSPGSPRNIRKLPPRCPSSPNTSVNRKTPTGHTGLGGSVFTWIAEKYKEAPPKMSLFSKYERQKDRRTMTERRLIFEDFEAAKAANLIVFKH